MIQPITPVQKSAEVRENVKLDEDDDPFLPEIASDMYL